MMGAYSTIRITRSKARSHIMQQYLMMNDEQMEIVLDQLLGERLYNVRIVNDDEENDDTLL